MPNYQPDPNESVEYFLINYTKTYGGMALAQIAKYDDRDNIPQAGSVVTPVAESTIMKEHILSLTDSLEMQLGYIGYRGFAIPMDEYEVPLGYVTSIVIKFIPGYEYDNGDTIRKEVFNLASGDWVSDDVLKNTFGVPVIVNQDFAAFTDAGEGYNGRLMEDMYVRYDNDSNTLKHADWNPNKHQMYLPWYFAIPIAAVGISIDTTITGIMPGTAVKEPDAIVSKIYPNPANDQVRIELLNGEAAELRIMNTLGQVLMVATLNEMTNTIDCSSLHSGVYVLRVSQGGSVSTTKMIKK
jgi:hypothetical protein